MGEQYLVMYNTDDGAWTNQWTKEELMLYLTTKKDEVFGEDEELVFLDEFPGMSCGYLQVPRDEKTYIFITKTNVIVPVVKKVITQYEIK